jgi:hypothetical protein
MSLQGSKLKVPREIFRNLCFQVGIERSTSSAVGILWAQGAADVGLGLSIPRLPGGGIRELERMRLPTQARKSLAVFKSSLYAVPGGTLRRVEIDLL